MNKWYEEEAKDKEVVVESRIRLLRNLKDYVFPGELSRMEKRRLNEKIIKALEGISLVTGTEFEPCNYDTLSEEEKKYYYDRKIINEYEAFQSGPMGIVSSKDEGASIILNMEDHIQIQVSKAGSLLEDAYLFADKIDDYINQHFSYAFDEKYGYLTSFPTNLGTGLRAYMVMHLPLLSMGERMGNLLSKMALFGVRMKGVFGEWSDNPGHLFVVYNQKTLGCTEKEITDIVYKLSYHLVEQEKKLEELEIKNFHDMKEDLVYRAYGMLNYARSMSLKDALENLSLLRQGMYQGLIKFERPIEIYRLMIEIQDSCLRFKNKSLRKERDFETERAKIIRECLPAIL